MQQTYATLYLETNMAHHPFACALPIGTTKFLWLLAGRQRQATNDPKFKAVTTINHSAAPLDSKFNTEVTQPQKEK